MLKGETGAPDQYSEVLYSYIDLPDTLLGMPVHLAIYAIIQSGNHVAGGQCVKSCGHRRVYVVCVFHWSPGIFTHKSLLSLHSCVRNKKHLVNGSSTGGKKKKKHPNLLILRKAKLVWADRKSMKTEKLRNLLQLRDAIVSTWNRISSVYYTFWNQCYEEMMLFREKSLVPTRNDTVFPI